MNFEDSFALFLPLSGACPVCGKPMSHEVETSTAIKETVVEMGFCESGHYSHKNDFGDHRVTIGDDEWCFVRYSAVREGEIHKAIISLRHKEKAMLPEQRAFLLVIRENAYDDTTRIIYADWLEDHDQPEEADRQRNWSAEVQRSEDWMRDFAQKVSLPYKTVMQAGEDFLETGDRYSQLGTELARDMMNIDMVRAQFWKHWQIIKGQEVPKWKQTSAFMCSC